MDVIPDFENTNSPRGTKGQRDKTRSKSLFEAQPPPSPSKQAQKNTAEYKFAGWEGIAFLETPRNALNVEESERNKDLPERHRRVVKLYRLEKSKRLKDNKENLKRIDKLES